MTFVDICAWTVLLVLVRGQFGTRTGDLDSLPPPTRCLVVEVGRCSRACPGLPAGLSWSTPADAAPG
jgi:hypothetical protein